jgi:predicted nucleic acid-binding protein
VALSDPSDLQYRDAVAVESHLAGAKIITTEEVLSEFLTFFAADAWLRDRASRAVQALLNSSSVRVIPQSRETFLAGLALYRQRPDKGYSLTDRISMQTMRREGSSKPSPTTGISNRKVSAPGSAIRNQAQVLNSLPSEARAATSA